MDFRQTSIVELVRQIRGGDMSAVEVTAAALENIEKVDGQLNSFCSVNPERALAEALAIDTALGRGENLPLAGIPIGVKDLEDAAGYVTSFGSDLHIGDPEAEQDSELVRRLKAEGCGLCGCWKDQYARIWTSWQDRQCALWHHAQPLEPRSYPGWIIGRHSCSASCGSRAACHWVGWRRLYSYSSRIVWPEWHKDLTGADTQWWKVAAWQRLTDRQGTDGKNEPGNRRGP